ncbi:D-tagatose-1,6-bisphosphate aldolase subunit KbaZ [compost metagenome]
MTPADFRGFVEKIADSVGFNKDMLILGGDHLGPNPWKHLPAASAMQKALVMIADYASAGFTKLHLDCSMGCQGEAVALDDELVALRAAQLAKVAENNCETPPVYIIGTEVPVPGGASHVVDSLDVTDASAALKTYEIHRKAFQDQGVGAAFDRVIGLVVQPGVEFGSANVVAYRPELSQELSKSLTQMPNVVFEAHSTDYQTVDALSALVTDGFSILKVGPGLTFALREALYGLDLIAAELDGGTPKLKDAMEMLMVEEEGYWANYYSGDKLEQKLQRHFSYSDRIRYYWAHPKAQNAVTELMLRLENQIISETLISQYLAPLVPAVRSGEVEPNAASIKLGYVKLALNEYARACV